jgi:hypothetical protein
MALIDPLITRWELRDVADQFFACYAAHLYAQQGRGILYVALNAAEGTARSTYKVERELAAIPHDMSKLIALVNSYDATREAIVAYVAVPEGRVRAVNVVRIEWLS